MWTTSLGCFQQFRFRAVCICLRYSCVFAKNNKKSRKTLFPQHYLFNKNTFGYFFFHSVGKLRNWRRSNPVSRRSSGDCWRNQVRPFRETVPGSVFYRHTTPLLDHHLSASAEHLKTTWDKRKEEELMGKLLEIVNDRNAIVEGLDEDRLRWVWRVLLWIKSA